LLFAQFCGRLFEALGYTTRVSPPGADQGIDVVASEDALGVKPPLLKVQCKSSNSPSSSEQVQALNGALGPTDIGVFIAVGGFTTPAKQVAAGMPRMRLIGPAELVELVVDHYLTLPDEAKTDLPLRRVWMPDRPSVEE
jgi:restriction system protein